MASTRQIVMDRDGWCGTGANQSSAVSDRATRHTGVPLTDIGAGHGARRFFKSFRYNAPIGPMRTGRWVFRKNRKGLTWELGYLRTPGGQVAWVWCGVGMDEPAMEPRPRARPSLFCTSRIGAAPASVVPTGRVDCGGDRGPAVNCRATLRGPYGTMGAHAVSALRARNALLNWCCAVRALRAPAALSEHLSRRDRPIVARHFNWCCAVRALRAAAALSEHLSRRDRPIVARHFSGGAGVTRLPPSPVGTAECLPDGDV